MEESTRDLEQRISQATSEFGRLREIHRVLGGHLENAQRKFQESEAALARSALALESLAGAVGEEAEQPLLNIVR